MARNQKYQEKRVAAAKRDQRAKASDDDGQGMKANHAAKTK